MFEKKNLKEISGNKTGFHPIVLPDFFHEVFLRIDLESPSKTAPCILK